MGLARDPQLVDNHHSQSHLQHSQQRNSEQFGFLVIYKIRKAALNSYHVGVTNLIII